MGTGYVQLIWFTGTVGIYPDLRGTRTFDALHPETAFGFVVLYLQQRPTHIHSGTINELKRAIITIDSVRKQKLRSNIYARNHMGPQEQNWDDDNGGSSEVQQLFADSRHNRPHAGQEGTDGMENELSASRIIKVEVFTRRSTLITSVDLRSRWTPEKNHEYTMLGSWLLE